MTRRAPSSNGTAPAQTSRTSSLAGEAQQALARASRLTALGEITVSIAHEVNQPLMAIVTNAATCMRWLEGDPINVAEARLAADRIIRDGHRAGDVIASIRAMARKNAAHFVRIDVNSIITRSFAAHPQ